MAGRTSPLRILISPDSFKGSLSCEAAARAMARGCRRVLPDACITRFPVADGGEGTLQVLKRILGGRLIVTRAVDPLGRPIPAAWLKVGHRAFIESARTAGITLLAPSERDPCATTSFGVGMLILAAAQSGCREIFVTLGGSATSDGGIGALTALGVRFTRTDGSPVTPGTGRDLLDLAHAETSGLAPVLEGKKIILLSDVNNPLCGPRGAAVVYGPQKGATPAAVHLLDRGLHRFARIAERTTGHAIRSLPGAGAAGGMAGGFAAFLGGGIHSGIETILDIGRYDHLLENSDLLLTGEGCLDGQSFSGKALGVLFRRASRSGVPVIALAGAVSGPARRRTGPGVAAFSIVPGPLPAALAMARAGSLLADAATEALKAVLLGRRLTRPAAHRRSRKRKNALA